MSEWQPIESAPKIDGKGMLAAGTISGVDWVSIVYWAGWDECCWYSSVGSVVEPTHWMPLPAHPNETQPSHPDTRQP